MRSESGQALPETLLLSLILLVPLIWGLGVLADLHRTALATAAAARDAGVRAARASGSGEAALSIDAAVTSALADHDIRVRDVEVGWRALPRFERGARVEIVVRYPVPVAQAPLLGRVAGPSIWITARHVARVHPFIGR